MLALDMCMPPASSHASVSAAYEPPSFYSSPIRWRYACICTACVPTSKIVRRCLFDMCCCYAAVHCMSKICRNQHKKHMIRIGMRQLRAGNNFILKTVYIYCSKLWYASHMRRPALPLKTRNIKCGGRFPCEED